MSFIEERFPPKVSLGAKGGPQFVTDVVTVNSGYEFRNAVVDQPLAKYEVGHNVRNEVIFRELLAFFRIVHGRANGFRFKDWSDYQATLAQGIIVSEGSPLDSQLYKRYTFGSSTFDRKITKPVSGTVTIVGGGTLNYTTGQILGGSPTAWYGEFDVPCRFDTDLFDGEIIDGPSTKHVYGWPSIQIVEIRLPE